MKWKPQEIIITRTVKDDAVTESILRACQNVPVKYIDSAKPCDVMDNSDILRPCKGGAILDKLVAGKHVLHISTAPADAVKRFDMADSRMQCPHFYKLVLASNGCYYHCQWCYLKLTFGYKLPFIKLNAEYDVIQAKIERLLNKSPEPIMFNSGELADSLALDHLTHAGSSFIPWFGKQKNGYLFMLTKSTNVDDILDLNHNGHTIVAWSINNAAVSRKYEVGAPAFDDRLEAARKVQDAGYRLRLRLDPIVPVPNWQGAYAETIKKIFKKVNPERITLGTLRFEPQFYFRRTELVKDSDVREFMAGMKPMLEPKLIGDSKFKKSGKYSFSEDERYQLFKFAINEIKKYSDCPIALCKESAEVWDRLKLKRSRCRCVCQYNYADLTQMDSE